MSNGIFDDDNLVPHFLFFYWYHCHPSPRSHVSKVHPPMTNEQPRIYWASNLTCFWWQLPSREHQHCCIRGNGISVPFLVQLKTTFFYSRLLQKRILCFGKQDEVSIAHYIFQWQQQAWFKPGDSSSFVVKNVDLLSFQYFLVRNGTLVISNMSSSGSLLVFVIDDWMYFWQHLRTWHQWIPCRLSCIATLKCDVLCKYFTLLLFRLTSCKISSATVDRHAMHTQKFPCLLVVELTSLL